MSDEYNFNEDMGKVPVPFKESPWYKRLVANVAKLPKCENVDRSNLSPGLYKQKAQREFEKTAGRWGMLRADLFNFEAFPVSRWTMVQLQNRLKWLKDERRKLLGSGQTGKLEENREKIGRYNRELMRRYSHYQLEQARKENNAMRRRKRKMAKIHRTAALIRAWKEKKRAERETYRLLIHKENGKTVKPS